MNRPNDGGGTYSSIDPTALQGAASALTKTADGITDSIVPLRSRFATGGVSTAHLDKLGTMASTIADYKPELTRRISLAQFACQQHPEWKGRAYMQSDSLGDFKTTAAAQAAARKIAAKVKKDGLDDATLYEIQKHGLDPDYAEALVKALGPGALLKELNTNTISDRKPIATQVLGNMLATASYRIDFNYDYFKPVVEGKPHFINPLYIMAPYIKEGVWSSKALGQMADLRFKGSGHPGKGWVELDSDQSVEQAILKGLSNNPAAAADYFSKNHDLLYGYMRNEKMLLDKTKGSWAEFVKAATVDARNIDAIRYLDKPGDNPAIKNASWLMKKVAGDGDNWYDEMTDTFASVSAEYMDDYAYTLGSPIDPGQVQDPGHDGVSVSTADWQKFLKTSMHSNNGIVLVAAAMKKKIDELRTRSTLEEAHSPTDSANAGFWDKYTAGAMESTFRNLFGEVAKDRTKEADDKKGFWDGIADKAVDWALDPGGIIKDVGTTAVKDLLHLAVDSAFDPKKMPSMPNNDFDTKQGFAKDAVTRLGINPDFDKDKDLPFKKYNDGDVTWDGNPKLYTEPSPPNGDFTKYVHDGKMSDDIKKDAPAWSSYNQWLHDPAVQNSVADGYAYELIGGLQGK